MKIRFAAILSVEAALRAVEQNGYALRYVLDPEMFVRIAEKCGIEIAD